MLREPTQVPKVAARKDNKKGRFQIVRLEERIAPTCHTNPQGKDVGSCGKHGGGHGGYA